MKKIFEDDDCDDERPSLLDKIRSGPLGLNKQQDYDPLELPKLLDPIELPKLSEYEPIELSPSKQYDDWKTNEFLLTGKHPDFDKPEYLKQCDYDPSNPDSTMRHYSEALEMSKGNVIYKEQEDWKPQEFIVKDKPLDKAIATPCDYKPGADAGMNSFLDAVEMSKK